MQIPAIRPTRSNEFILAIDASNIRAGGGVTHLRQLLAAANPGESGFKRVVVLGGRSSLENLPQRDWLQKIHVPLLDKDLSFRLFWQQLILPRYVRRNGYDALFCPGGTLPYRLYVPSIVLSQNLLPFEQSEASRFSPWSMMRLKLRLLRLFQSRSMSMAYGLIFLTNYAKDQVLKTVVNHTSRIAIIPHGIEKRFFLQPRIGSPISEFSFQNPFRFLYVSIVDMYKHQWHVAEAISLLRKKGLPVAIDFIGPAYPPALRRLQKTMQELDPAGEYLRYKGPVAFAELHITYQKADAFVFASSCENLPNILLEAMAAGLPIASSNKGPMPEILGNAGIYFDPESVAQIAAALQSLFEQSELRSTLAHRAYDKARQYSWTRCAKDTFDFIADGIRAAANT